MTYILTAGQSYMVRLRVRNDSVNSVTGQPSAATLGVGVAAAVDSTIGLIPFQVRQEYFGAGQTRTFDYPFTVPSSAQNVGGVNAWIEDPGGAHIAEAAEAIMMRGYTITMGGRITDISTGLVVDGVSIELRDQTGAVLQTTVSRADGLWEFTIELIKTYIFSFAKAGYVDQVTQPLFFDAGEVGGYPFSIELVPVVPTTSILYVNPSDHFWYLHDKNMGLLAGYMLSQEAVSLPIPAGPEVYNIVTLNQQFGNKYFWGPFVLDLSAGGTFVLNPGGKTLNGAPVISLRSTQGNFLATVISYVGSEDPDDPNIFVTLRIDQADPPGFYWTGEVIGISVPYLPLGRIAALSLNKQVMGVLKMGTGTIGEPRWSIVSLQSL